MNRPFNLEQAPATLGNRLLIIDDKPALVYQLSLIVRDFGEVLFAMDGSGGVALAQSQRPNLILLDVEMTPMNGFEVCSALKSNVATADIPIIFVTGNHGADNEVACLNAGGNDFISKPLIAEVVRARVRTQLALQRANNDLKKLSVLDPLTGLYNRRFMDEQLAIECSRHCREVSELGLAIIDVDYFKVFNDALGHQAGDAALVAVAAALQNAARRPGDLVCRYGGEEFVIVMPNCTEKGLIQYATHLQELIAALSITHPMSPLNALTVSVGMSSATPGLQFSCSDLIRAADQALYKAKSHGRNRSVYQAVRYEEVVLPLPQS